MFPEKIVPINNYTYEPLFQTALNTNIILFSDKTLISQIEKEVWRQLYNVACLPGVVSPVCAMPDTHAGYGFPIGGVAAFDPERGGVICAGGVGFDIACGVRTLLSPLSYAEVKPIQKELADALFQALPAGVGSKAKFKLSIKQLDQLLLQGTKWAVKQGFGEQSDLEFIEDRGEAKQARPDYVSDKAKKRQQQEMGTLGAGNHYAEIQVVEKIFEPNIAKIFGLKENQIVISIHCGSRGLGHQVATDYIAEMLRKSSVSIPDKNLACAPIFSKLADRYLGAMYAAFNCAWVNRQILTHLIREVFSKFFKAIFLPLLYDVSHNTCRQETYKIDGKERLLFIHRKGATRSFGPNHPDLPLKYKNTGQPVLIGGSMGTKSYILAGTNKSLELSFGSTCHGAGRIISRKQAKKTYSGKILLKELSQQGIEIRCRSFQGLAEEAPLAYKDVAQVVEITHNLGLAKKVAQLKPVIVIKG
ncbi:MAG: RtcB family protein [Desulfonauticus sp.]|nr:RtcB family protein [Desulfonauticus sp.]